jgi:hypothetical protein
MKRLERTTNPMSTIDIKEIVNRGFKGDEDAHTELMELAEDAHNSGKFEFSSDCYRQAALVYKRCRWHDKLNHDETVSKFKWSQLKLNLYEDYCKKQNYPVREYNHSFSSTEDVVHLIVKFMDLFAAKYQIPFSYFEEVLTSQGVVFSSPGNSSLRYLARAICSALGFSDPRTRTLPKTPNFKVRIALDAIIPDFLDWAEKTPDK